MACAMLFYTCTKDNKKDLFPCGSLANISYSIDVQPILEASCYSCHNNANATIFSGGRKFEDYQDLLVYARSGSLVCSVDHGDGCVAMPLGQAKISSCAISKIEAWVDQGAKEN